VGIVARVLQVRGGVGCMVCYVYVVCSVLA
jgi:hypothetical protein